VTSCVLLVITLQPNELIDRPLEERRRLLQAVITVESGHVELIECEEVRSQDHGTRIERLNRCDSLWHVSVWIVACF
jgi:hypothetical protein